MFTAQSVHNVVHSTVDLYTMSCLQHSLYTMLFTVQLIYTQCHVYSTVCTYNIQYIHNACHLPCWLLSQGKTGAVGVQELVSLAPPAFGLSAVWLVMATTATLRLTRSTYETNEPKNVITARMYRAGMNGSQSRHSPLLFVCELASTMRSSSSSFVCFFLNQSVRIQLHARGSIDMVECRRVLARLEHRCIYGLTKSRVSDQVVWICD